MNSSGLSLLCTRYVSQSSIGFRVKNCAKNTSSLINSSAFFLIFSSSLSFSFVLVVFDEGGVFIFSFFSISWARSFEKFIDIFWADSLSLFAFCSHSERYKRANKSRSLFRSGWCSSSGVQLHKNICNDFPQKHKRRLKIKI